MVLANASLTSLACLAMEMPKFRQSLQSAMTKTMMVTMKKKRRIKTTDRQERKETAAATTERDEKTMRKVWR